MKSKMNSFLSAVDGVLDIQEANVCVLNDAGGGGGGNFHSKF